jgi:hypothetical protein
MVAYALEIKASTSCQIGHRFQNDTDYWFEHKTNCFETLKFDSSTTPYQLVCDQSTNNVHLIAPMGQITPYGVFNINLVETKMFALIVKQATVNLINKCDHWFEDDPGFSCPDGHECHRESFISSDCIKRCVFGSKKTIADYDYVIDIQEVYWYSRPAVKADLKNIENYVISAHADIDSCNHGFIISNGQTYCIDDPSNAPRWIFLSNSTFKHEDVVVAIKSLFDLKGHCNELLELYREPLFSDATTLSVYADMVGTSTVECPESVGIMPCTEGSYFFKNGTFFVTFKKLCILDNTVLTGAEYQHCTGCNTDCSWSVRGNGENRTCSRGLVHAFRESKTSTNTKSRYVCHTASIICYVMNGILILQWLYVLIHVIVYLIDYCKTKEESKLIQASHGKFIKKNYMTAAPFEREAMQEAFLNEILKSRNQKIAESLEPIELEPISSSKVNANKKKAKFD